MKPTFDSVIVGSGICGLAFAFWIKKFNPQEKVLVIEANQNFSSSRKNAGFITSGSLKYFLKLEKSLGLDTAQKVWTITKQNIDLIEKFIKENNALEIVDLKKNGSITYLHKEDFLKFEELRTKTNLFSKIYETENDFLKIKNKRLLFDPSESSFDPLKFNDYLISYLKNIGVSFKLKDFVEDINVDHDICKVKIKNEFINANRVFIATNDQVLINMLFPNQVLITRNRAQIQSYQLNKKISDSANIYIPDEKIYLRVSDSKLIIGGLRSLDEANEKTNILGLNQLIQDALKEFVSSNVDKDAILLNQWSGIMGFTENELPKYFIGPDKRIIFLGGFSGHGNGLAFNLANLLVHGLLTSKFDHALSPFVL